MNFIDQVLSMENNGRLISQISAPLVAIVEIIKKKNTWQQPGLRIIHLKGAYDSFSVRRILRLCNTQSVHFNWKV